MPDRMEAAERRGLDMSEKYVVDSLGDKCPVPVVKAKKALDKAMPGDVIEVHVDNDIAVQNLRKLASNMQCSSVDRQLEAKHFVVEITAGEAGGGRETTGALAGDTGVSQAGTADPFHGISCEIGGSPAEKSYLVAVASDTMGEGDPALGKILMKGFLYALSQMDTLPETILFYNGGVMLTTEGSESLEDLKAMEEQGVKIYSCGTCLDFYDRKDLLKVGEVTNMYTIVELMAKAEKILKP